MTKLLIKLVFLVCLLTSGYCDEGVEVDLENPTIEKFNKMLADPVKAFIIIAHKTECSQKCLEELSVVVENSPRLKMMDTNLEIYKLDISKMPEVQDHLILDTDHGVWYIYRGESIRVDTNDLSPEQTRHLLNDLSAIVQRRVALLDNMEDIRNINHTYKTVHVFYGKKTDINFTELEIASKLTERDIFRVENPSIAALFKLESPGMYTYEKEHKDSIRMKGELSRGKVLKFLLASSRPVPQEFDPEKI